MNLSVWELPRTFFDNKSKLRYQVLLEELELLRRIPNLLVGFRLLAYFEPLLKQILITSHCVGNAGQTVLRAESFNGCVPMPD